MIAPVPKIPAGPEPNTGEGRDPNAAPAYCTVGEGLVCTAYAGMLRPCGKEATRRFQDDETGSAYCDEHFQPQRQDLRNKNRVVLLA